MKTKYEDEEYSRLNTGNKYAYFTEHGDETEFAEKIQIESSDGDKSAIPL